MMSAAHLVNSKDPGLQRVKQRCVLLLGEHLEWSGTGRETPFHVAAAQTALTFARWAVETMGVSPDAQESAVRELLLEMLRENIIAQNAPEQVGDIASATARRLIGSIPPESELKDRLRRAKMRMT